MGAIDGHLIGPYFLSQNIKAENYENFLREHLPELIMKILVDTRNNISFQHDGCSAYYAVNVKQFLN